MYDVMAVDDYEAFLTQLAQFEFWKKHSDEFNLKFLETDSVKALDTLRKNNADILITDIKMPKMNGLELLTRVKEEKLCACCILLSAHAEFEYARKAIALDAFDYMTKPVTEKQFENVMLRAANFLDTDSENPMIATQTNIVAECILHSEKGFEEKCAALAEVCKNAVGENTIKNCAVLSDAVFNIYNRVCSKFEWVEKLVINPRTVREKILQSNDIRSSESFMAGFLREIYNTVKTYYPQNMNNLVNTAVDYILKNSSSRLSLGEVADACYANHSYLSHTFKQSIGISFVDYIVSYKMCILKRSLTETDQSLSEISESLGYEDTKYMGRLFKNVYGITPSEYRKLFVS